MHIIWEALNCLLSVMFECHFCQWLVYSLLIAFQQQVINFTIHMRKNDDLDNYLKKKKSFFFVF